MRGLVVLRSSADLTREARCKIQISKGTGNRALFRQLNLFIFAPKGIRVCGEPFWFGIANFRKFVRDKRKICRMIEIVKRKFPQVRER